jgi:hypothetical protein
MNDKRKATYLLAACVTTLCVSRLLVRLLEERRAKARREHTYIRLRK